MEKKLKEICLHLLDLGKRNRLINYKETGYKTIEVLNVNYEELFEKITNSAQLSVFQLDGVLQKYHATIEGTEESLGEYSIGKVRDIALPLLRPNDLLCYKKSIPLNKIMKSIYKDYKATLIEKGINPLYMTFGMVEYKEKEEFYYAPLLLIPLTCEEHNGGYKLKAGEDEVIVNPTLAYLLRTEYKLEIEEFDEKTDSLLEYQTKLSSLLKEREMRLLPRITVGIYSFLKMNMFNDLMNHQELVLQNQNIQRIMGAAIPFDVGKGTSVYPIVNADSSQLEAIQYAVNGGSFVLQGPPGSGKSQTITNIIASMIGNGKKVLFVSEKQAALNVVYENLRRAGIESFAAELHSHKTNKKDFIDELYRTAILPKYDIKTEASKVKHHYDYVKDTLEEYRQDLHKIIPRLGISLYEVYAKLLSLGKKSLKYSFSNIETLDSEYLAESLELCSQYTTISKVLGSDYHTGPFYGFISTDLSYIRLQAEADFLSLTQFFTQMLTLRETLVQRLPLQVKSYQDILYQTEYLSAIVQLSMFLPEFFVKTKREILIQQLEHFFKAKAYLEKSTLKNFLDLALIKTDVESLLKEFKLQSQKRLKLISIRYHKTKKELRGYTKIKMKDKDLLIKLEEACQYKKQLILFQRSKKALPEGYKTYEYEAMLKDLQSLRKLPFDLVLTNEKYGKLKNELLEILMFFNRQKGMDLSQYTKNFDSSILNIIQDDIKLVVQKLQQMSDNVELLSLHAQRLEILKKLSDLNLLSYLDKFLENKQDIEQLKYDLEFQFYQANMYYELDHNPVIKEFSGLGVEAILQEFKELDEAKFAANKAYIISKLSKERPDDSILAGSRFAVLIKEYNKSRKQKPIRRLLEEIFDFIISIKPVFLMSPLSISTYLPSTLELFDVVIFDEASQVFSWDALGAIYRAKQCIIIGDSKQMPPSTFFTSTQYEEEDEENYEDVLESILDKGGSIFPTKRLLWHYRSRSEELIAFSNQKFYESGLITIPQAKSHEPGFGIDFHYLPNGIYEVKSRTNLQEANYITDLVFRHFRDKPNQSLGVVAFSNAQADLISDLIEERMKDHQELFPYFAEDKEEPFFVKNLESVQGDERDVIFFSICYGYTKENRFYQRFGPLNTVGGERRLNVAITRAKMNVCVVSSIRSSDIRLENTESIGVKLLKSYLSYAEDITTPKHWTEEVKDGVLLDVSRYLLSQGFLVQKRVGSSSFKIDIAVLHPATKEFVAAIMLDGPSYCIGNCGDANRLQELLLERLGWRFYRIFSTLWLHQEKLEKEKLLQFLKQVFTDKLPNKVNRKEETYLLKNEETIDDSFEEYQQVSPEEIRRLSEKKSIPQIIRHIVQREGPIHQDYLLKRICFLYGRTKVTAPVRAMFLEDLDQLSLFSQDGFLGVQPFAAIGLRINSDRDIEYIPLEELKDAIYKIVKKSNGITKEGCYKAVGRLLGYSRVSEHAVSILENALVFLKLDGVLVEKHECLYI